MSGPEEQDERLTTVPVSILKGMLAFSCSTCLWLPSALSTSTKHTLALSSFPLLCNILLRLGFETGTTIWPRLASTSNGQGLLTAEHTDVQPHAQKNAFLQPQVFDSNAMEANPKKENL